MNVIARKTGPKYTNGIEGIILGKEYEIVSYNKHNGHQWESFYLKENESIIIPMKPILLIQVRDERGVVSSFWNDYFFSSEEMRDQKLNKLLDENQ